MLRFKVFENGAPARSMNLDGAHLIGNDHVPIRAEFRFEAGELIAETRTRGAAALAIMWPVKGGGRLMLETPRLMERTQPYILSTELARGELMRISHKREDWGLYDLPEGKPHYEEVDKAREILLNAITAADDSSAFRFGELALEAGIRASDSLCLFQADYLTNQRRTAGPLARRPLGCLVDPSQAGEAAAAKLAAAFDFAALPFHWSALQPKNGKYNTAPLEQALGFLKPRKLPVWGTSVLSFQEGEVPAWLGSAVKNYEQLRDLIGRHLRSLFKAFDGHVQAWEVVSGLHAHNRLRLNFEQIMELTRMAALAARQASPRCAVILGIELPWGEYYAADPQSIPPAMYAEMAVQSGVHFDGFGIHLQFGGQAQAQFVRTLLQLSSLLDRFGSYGKPLHVMMAGVPSTGMTPVSGFWREEWSEPTQAEWMRSLCRIAYSKPFVESVCWQVLADGAQPSPYGGVLRAGLSPKPSYEMAQVIRRDASKA